ncbi:hypothetical protein GCM10027051_08820 [Niabella terrae]
MILSVEELAINDSFISFILETDEQAAVYWNDYLLQYPQELETLQEARILVLGLRKMLQQKQNELSADQDSSDHHLYVAASGAGPETPGHRSSRLVSINRIAIAVAVAVLVSLGWFWYRQDGPQDVSVAARTEPAGTAAPLIATAGQRRSLTLADGTRVTLNDQTQLELAADFGVRNRDVFLSGEALFDVAHNKALPFIVHVTHYSVKAVGTRFNVKAYASDAFSETALLEGRVQILLNKSTQKAGKQVFKTLEVNQKFIMNNGTDLVEVQKQTVELPKMVLPLSFDESHQNIETAWVSDQMIFDNQTLAAIAAVLERRFNVQFEFKDPLVKKIQYSASFKQEDLQQILGALQYSYPFHFEQEGNRIIIHK